MPLRNLHLFYLDDALPLYVRDGTHPLLTTLQRRRSCAVPVHSCSRCIR